MSEKYQRHIDEIFENIDTRLCELDARQLIGSILRKVQENFAEQICSAELSLDFETDIAIDRALNIALEKAFAPYVYNLCYLSDKVLGCFEWFGLRPHQTLSGIANAILLEVLTQAIATE